jgi:hypothetical protein
MFLNPCDVGRPSTPEHSARQKSRRQAQGDDRNASSASQQQRSEQQRNGEPGYRGGRACLLQPCTP